MSLPRYAEYKDSRVPWIGQVPAHWDIAPLKRLLDIQNGTDHKDVECSDGFPVIGSGGQFAHASDYLYDGESVLLGRKGTIDKPLYISGKFWTVDTMYWSVILPGANGRFTYYAALTIPFEYYSTNTALPSMTKGALSAHLVAQPPIDEQTAIAIFLDEEISKIDALIAEQEKLVALLVEKRQATISHAVTRGLDPDVPMKESDVPWMGRIPAHWNVFPIKRDLNFLTSGSRGWADHYADEGALFIRIGNLTRGHVGLDLDDVQRVVVPEGAEGERTRVMPGDLLFSITAYLGSVAVVPANIELAFVSQHVALARLQGKQLLPVWVAYVCLSWIGTTFLALQGYGGTKVQLSLDDVANLVSTAPPLAEQSAILEFLDREVSKADLLAAQAEHAIALLKERRSALIAAAVTGQIDVRGAVAAEATP